MLRARLRWGVLWTAYPVDIGVDCLPLGTSGFKRWRNLIGCVCPSMSDGQRPGTHRLAATRTNQRATHFLSSNAPGILHIDKTCSDHAVIEKLGDVRMEPVL